MQYYGELTIFLMLYTTFPRLTYFLNEKFVCFNLSYSMFPMYIFIPNNVYLAMKLKICHYGCELREMRVDMNVFTLLLPFSST